MNPLTYFIPIFIFFVAGMLPTLVAFFGASAQDRYRILCIFNFNLCGMFPYLYRMVSADDQMSLLADFMMDPMVWMIMYGGASVGWIIYTFVPLVVRFTIGSYLGSKITNLKKDQIPLVEEWGNEVKTYAQKYQQPIGTLPR